MTEDVQQESKTILDINIGTKEPVVLKPGKVQVQGVKIHQNMKDGKVTSEMIKLLCKHPDKEELIELSNVKILRTVGKEEKITLVALWLNKDSDGNLDKSSSAAKLLKFYGKNNFGDLVGVDIEAVNKSEGDKYLCIKAY